jgi:K+-transporting ATPase KdpF subunit
MMDAMQLLAAVLAGGLFVYLLFAMLCPERFS